MIKRLCPKCLLPTDASKYRLGRYDYTCKRCRREEHKRRLKDRPYLKKASRAICKSVADGRIKKPSMCSSCKRHGDVEGHHPDYNKPYEVVWLCKKCHTSEHVRLRNEVKVGQDKE